MSANVLRQMEGTFSVKEPCITLVYGFFCVTKDDLFVAIERTTGEMLCENPFKPFNWSGSIFQLGKEIP